MSTIALDPRYHSGSANLSSPAVGEIAKRVGKITASAVDTIKARATRRSHVFEDLQSLANDNGMEVQQETAMVLAQRFLLALPLNLPTPELSLDDDGDVSLDWLGTRGEMLTVALAGNGRLAYAARFSSSDRDHGVKRFVDEIPQSVIQILQRFSRA